MKLNQRASKGAFSFIKDVQRKLEKTHLEAIEVGVLDDREHSNGEDKIKIYQIAAINYYGTRLDNGAYIPARYWFLICESLHERKFRKVFSKGYGGFLLGKSGFTFEKVMKELGEMRHKANVDILGDPTYLPPNALSTIKRKGFNKPLMETGELRDAQDWKRTKADKVQNDNII